MQPAIAGVMDGLVGIAEMLYSTMATGVNPRLRKELFSMGVKLALELIDPKTWEEKQASAAEVMSKIQGGDYLNAIFKTPDEILAALHIKKPATVTVTSEPVVVTYERMSETPDELEEGAVWRKLSA